MPTYAIKLILTLCLLLSKTASADYDFLLPMTGTDSGSYSVSAKVGDTADSVFLIDTGASLSTISRDLFKKIKDDQHVTHVRRIAARLANGKFQSADVYRITNFVIGSQCEIESIEVAVMPHNGRNILGMNVLAMTAPFGLNIQKKALAVSQCEPNTVRMSASLAVVQ